MQEIINLTPHALNIITNGGTLTVPPSGDVARVEQTRSPKEPVNGIPVTLSNFGDVIDLPVPVDGIIYIVSGLVLSAVPERNDVFAPGELVRDSNGKVVGCNGLSCTPSY